MPLSSLGRPFLNHFYLQVLRLSKDAYRSFALSEHPHIVLQSAPPTGPVPSPVPPHPSPLNGSGGSVNLIRSTPSSVQESPLPCSDGLHIAPTWQNVARGGIAGSGGGSMAEVTEVRVQSQPHPVMPGDKMITQRVPPTTCEGGGKEGERGCGVGKRVDGRGGPPASDDLFLNYADKTHTWAFGAVAELIHNSADAKATEVRVSLDTLGPNQDANFVVVDNGHGMTHQEMLVLFTLGKAYGYNSAAVTGERIGCNGLGFKQGVLRLGDTAAVITVRGEQDFFFQKVGSPSQLDFGFVLRIFDRSHQWHTRLFLAYFVLFSSVGESNSYTRYRICSSFMVWRCLVVVYCSLFNNGLGVCAPRGFEACS